MSSKTGSAAAASNPPGDGAIGTPTKSLQRWAQTKDTYTSDPRYRKYGQQVERCLNSFDNVQEWADCIAFLKQLLKTLQSYMQFKEIPRKLVVAKRLSQCLNPALPTGVHQRALELYAHIFSVIGPEGLKADLPLWSSGLFPFFDYAATSVKPVLLNLYETHYIPLQSALRPAMKSFILCLLPGLEEETGEYFEKVLGLLDKLSGTVSPAFFLQNMWLIMLTTPSARGTALNFLARRLPRLNADEDITPIVGRDTGLMIRAFAAALEDENLLVRRAALDLLVQSIQLDSATVKHAPRDDRVILMRAASSVVLRRDLSLNRRLYTWLLGADEKSEIQVQYFRTHSLELLAATLKDEMVRPAPGYSASRPFKIFISLQDKWEVGGPLSDVLVLDAFKAIRMAMGASETGADEMIMTANTFYESVEPLALWKQVFISVVTEVTGQSTNVEGIRLARFLLTTFSHDEEVVGTHLPVIFAGVVDLVKMDVCSGALSVPAAVIREIYLLFETILQHLPRDGSSLRPMLRQDLDESLAATAGPYVFACEFYGIPPKISQANPQRSSTVPVVTAFEDLVVISLTFAETAMRDTEKSTSALEAFAQGQLLLTAVLDVLQAKGESQVKVRWDPEKFISVILDVVHREGTPFAVIDHTVTLAESLHRCEYIDPKLTLDNHATLSIMIKKLSKYLRANFTGYHLRTVNLIWSLEALLREPHIESILAQALTNPSVHDMQEEYDAFGALWRLTEDSLLPGFRLKVPIFIVLDTLKSNDTNVRRIGETWMRCNLRSYLRILDPILHDLLDPNIKWTSTTLQLNGKQLQGFLYARPVDQRYMSHLLEILLSVVRFGGQGFMKTVRGTPVQRSLSPQFKQRVDDLTAGRPDATYLDCLIELLLRLLQSEPQPRWLATMSPMNCVIQSLTVDLLQMLVSRGDTDDISLEIIQAAVVSKLYFSIHSGRLDLQNKLLHLLHSVLSASSALNIPTSNTESSPALSHVRSTRTSQEGVRGEKTANPLLVQTLVDGISVQRNSPLYHQWLDFILMTIPQFQHTLRTTISPLIDCVCHRLRLSLTDVVQASYASRAGAEDKPLAVTDVELLTYLNALERLVMLSLSNRASVAQLEEDGMALERNTHDGGGLFGYVTTVFASEEATFAPDEQLTAKSQGYRSLHQSVRVLFAFWTMLDWKDPPLSTSMDASLSMIYSRARLRSRRVLEHFYRAHAAEVLESITQTWDADFQGSTESQTAAFELVDVLAENSQTVVHVLCDSISCRITGSLERSRRQAVNPNLSEDVLFVFLEAYLQRLEGPLAIQVWPRFLQLAKEIANSWREYKLQVYPTLRCITVLAEKIARGSALEDRRLRRDLQDAYGKLLDALISLTGRDPGTWMRRGGKESLAANGRDSPALRATPDLRLDEKTAPTASPSDNDSNTSFTVQMVHYLARNAIPRLRRFLVDADKILAVSQNVVYYIINPAMKGKTKPMDIEVHIVEILQELTRVPAALKAWRGVVSDTLNDTRVFNSTPAAGVSWKPVVAALVDTDKSAFSELLGKIATAPSANIFTNREHEMLLQSLSLRRLSYVLLTGEKNHFITQLPSVNEKLVDLLKNVSSPVVQSDVYLCMRVLICRLSPHNLTSFWPVILTELYRIFYSMTVAIPSDGSEDLPLILAAAKFLDLLLVLQTEEFQIHQWMFVTDTVDAVYRPENWSPEALMDHLAEIVGNLQESTSATQSPAMPPPPTPSPMLAEPSRVRRPMLNKVGHINSVRDLLPFFSHVSIASYESVYGSDGAIDWEAVESGILDDMFDGQYLS